MKKKLLPLLLLLPLHLFCQPLFKKVVYETNNQGIYVNGTHLKTNGELFISGNYANNQTHLSKIDSLGMPVWSKTFEGSDSRGYNQFGNQTSDFILPLSDGNYLLTRNSRDMTSGKNLTYLVKFSEAGDLVWSKSVHQNDISNNTNSLSAETTSGKILHVNSTDGLLGIHVLRLLTDGSVDTARMLSSTLNCKPVALLKVSSEFYVVATDFTNFETHVLRLNQEGEFLEAKKIAGFSANDGTFAQNNLYLTGSYPSNQTAVLKFDFNNASILFTNGLDFENTAKIVSNDSTVFVLSSSLHGSTIMKYSIANNNWAKLYDWEETIHVYELAQNRSYHIGNGPTYGVKKSYDPQIGLNLFDSTSEQCNSGYEAFNLETFSNSSFSISDFADVAISNFVADSISINWVNASPYSLNGCVDNLLN